MLFRNNFSPFKYFNLKNPISALINPYKKFQVTFSKKFTCLDPKNYDKNSNENLVTSRKINIRENSSEFIAKISDLILKNERILNMNVSCFGMQDNINFNSQDKTLFRINFIYLNCWIYLYLRI